MKRVLKTMRQFGLLFLITISVVVAFPPTALARSFHYTRIDVPFPEATDTQAFGISPTGEIVGSYWNSSGGVSHGFLLSHGVFTKFDAPFPGAPGGTVFQGINEAGEIVGETLTESRIIQ